MKPRPTTFMLIVLSTVAVALSCQKPVNPPDESRYPPDTRGQVTITQGAWGNVWFWGGNFMPVSWGKITPAVRMVYVYRLTNLKDVEQGSGPGYRKIYTSVVDSVLSNSTGFFQCPLDTGRYSFFVREDSLFYANGGDGYGNILPATIVKDSLTKVQIDITYRAVF